MAELRGLDFIGADFQLQPLPSGAINRSYALQAGQQRYFLKCFADNTPTRLNRQALFSMQKQLAAAGLASEPCYLSEQCSFMLETWQEVRTLEDIEVSVEEKVLILAGRMARIHQQNIDCPELDLVSDWHHYLQLAGIESGVLYNKVAEYQQYWQQLPKITFCHHDLAFAHLCIQPQGLVLDWEYQARSVAEFDLACAILVNQLDDQQARMLVERYGEATRQDTLALWHQAQALLPLAELTSELWYRAAEHSR
ncbi:phosphotransferase [Lacimicrobium alkaliphilum]|uniref:phosphotransferase n=1 Tax=Lacimicrobium alkaliphilum TaxID=1526571 RepID=UPI0018D202FA|nr:phosphotransferase [Lacimicrobium alkaliphilum]